MFKVPPKRKRMCININMYIYICISEVGGGESAAAPTGKSFRFVRACGRAGGTRARSIPVTKVDLQDDVVHLLPARWPFVASLLPRCCFCSAPPFF